MVPGLSPYRPWAQSVQAPAAGREYLEGAGRSSAWGRCVDTNHLAMKRTRQRPATHAPTTHAYLPAGHRMAMALVLPGGHAYPALHGPVHATTVSAGVDPNRPAAQGPVHAAVGRAAVTPNRPAAQSVHVAAPATLYLSRVYAGEGTSHKEAMRLHDTTTLDVPTPCVRVHACAVRGCIEKSTGMTHVPPSGTHRGSGVGGGWRTGVARAAGSSAGRPGQGDRGAVPTAGTVHTHRRGSLGVPANGARHSGGAGRSRGACIPASAGSSTNSAHQATGCMAPWRETSE